MYKLPNFPSPGFASALSASGAPLQPNVFVLNSSGVAYMVNSNVLNSSGTPYTIFR